MSSKRNSNGSVPPLCKHSSSLTLVMCPPSPAQHILPLPSPPLPSPTIPFHTIPYHTIPYHTIPYHTIPYHTIPYHKQKRTEFSSVVFVLGWSAGVLHPPGAPQHDRLHWHDQPGPQPALPARPLPSGLLSPHTGGLLPSCCPKATCVTHTRGCKWPLLFVWCWRSAVQVWAAVASPDRHNRH